MAKRVSPDRPDAITNEHLVGNAPVGKVPEPVAIDALSGNEPVHIELINVDYRVSVRINDKEIIATSDDDYHPDVKQLWDYEEEKAHTREAV
jgi:hypothetical protein